MLNPDTFTRAIQAIDTLGVTPAVLVKVVELAKDPDTDLATISASLRNDGPLVADIIRISNSPYYSPATFHGNLTSAIGQIGLREVIRVVNLSLSRQLFARDLPTYGITADDYWSTAVAAALMMDGFAKLVGLNPDDAYTAGVLHPIGRVLIDRAIEEQGFTVYWDGREPIADWERSIVGFDHAQAGAMLLEHWRFPTLTCDVIRWQLCHAKAAEQVSLLGLLQFVRRLLALTGTKFESTGWVFPESDPFVRASGLSPSLASQQISACREDLDRLRLSLDMV